MLATSSRGCHDDATRKLLPWNFSLTVREPRLFVLHAASVEPICIVRRDPSRTVAATGECNDNLETYQSSLNDQSIHNDHDELPDRRRRGRVCIRSCYDELDVNRS